MKRVAKKKVESEGSGGESVMRSLFRSLAMPPNKLPMAGRNCAGCASPTTQRVIVSSQCTSVREWSSSCASTATVCLCTQRSNAGR